MTVENKEREVQRIPLTLLVEDGEISAVVEDIKVVFGRSKRYYMAMDGTIRDDLDNIYVKQNK